MTGGSVASAPSDLAWAFLGDASARDDPYPALHKLRRSTPRLPLDDRTWLFTGHDDVRQVLVDPRFGTDWSRLGPPAAADDTAVDPLRGLRERMFSFTDGAEHRRLVRVFAPLFTPPRGPGIRERLREVVGRLVRDGSPHGVLDVVADLAQPLPVATTCALLRLPRSTWPVVTAWARYASDRLVPRGGEDGPAGGRGPEDVRVVIEDVLGRCDGPEMDAVRRDRESGLVNDDEVLANLLLAFIGGLESMSGLVGNLVCQLLSRPALVSALQRDPGSLRAVVEECVRLESPIRLVARVALDDVRMHEVDLPAGSVVLAVIAAANRDPARFDAPDAWRPGRAANLAFGAGPHTCLGRELARLQAEVVVEELFLRSGETPVAAVPTLRWSSSLVFRSLEALPIVLPGPWCARR